MNPSGDASSRPFAPFVPEASTLPELTFRAVFLGTAMAIVLGTANAYLGMRAGLTVAATFPAAVVAMAAVARTLDHRDAGPAGELRRRLPPAVAGGVAGAS